MKIRVSKYTIALLLAMSTIIYTSISAFLSQSGSTQGISLLSMMWLGVALFAVWLFLSGSKIGKAKRLSYLLVLYYIYAILVCLMNGYLGRFIAQPTFILSISFWIFIYYIFYECARNAIINLQRMSNLFFVLFLICFSLMVLYYNTFSSKEYYTGFNVVYYLLFMLPFILINQNKKVVYTSLVLVTISVILSAKRGALIALFVAGTLWFLNTDNGYSIWQKVSRLLKYLLVMMCFIALFAFVASKLDSGLLERMMQFITGEDSSGSGRFNIWKSYIDRIRNDDLLTILLGRGYCSTKFNARYLIDHLNWAHNDFLEVLMDYGVIGLSLLLSIIGQLFHFGKYMRKENNTYYASFVASIGIYFICSFVSMVLFESQWFLATAAFWGCIIGDYENRQKQMTKSEDLT